jgi:hypothetical protein
MGTARSVSGHTGPVAHATQELLLDHDVRPWMGERSLPLWLPMPDYAGFATRDNRAASRPDCRRDRCTRRLRTRWRGNWSMAPTDLVAGLTDTEERDLLLALPPR